MFVGTSPDVRLASPWFGGRTPNSSRMLFEYEIFLPGFIYYIFLIAELTQIMLSFE